jgi:hypothetical protein
VDIKYKVWYYSTAVHRPVKTGEVESLLPEESYSKEAEPKLRNGQDEF